MTDCPHRAVQVVRVYPDSADEERLTTNVGLAISSATHAPVKLHRASGAIRGWVFRDPCRKCEGE